MCRFELLVRSQLVLRAYFLQTIVTGSDVLPAHGAWLIEARNNQALKGSYIAHIQSSGLLKALYALPFTPVQLLWELSKSKQLDNRPPTNWHGLAYLI